MNVISHSHARLNLRFLHCKSHHAPLHTYVCYFLSLNSIFVSVSEQKFLHLSDNLNTDRCPPEAKTVLTFFWSVFFFLSTKWIKQVSCTCASGGPYFHTDPTLNKVGSMVNINLFSKWLVVSTSCYVIICLYCRQVAKHIYGDSSTILVT